MISCMYVSPKVEKAFESKQNFDANKQNLINDAQFKYQNEGDSKKDYYNKLFNFNLFDAKNNFQMQQFMDEKKRLMNNIQFYLQSQQVNNFNINDFDCGDLQHYNSLRYSVNLRRML
ncbi:hypothetical protein PPERSA_11254 [Pseudocohnilembus persalinus]|uniref:Uncharacterized protein n=1 Tax=Pseudocohnilembus persalinus TaxID=266149 RepID=A0A0V0QZG8_PSEPJ|nr:hypothetical protein PPERSA_11254 [Pseudocohnilembus persalinus]|eukprot:KRX07705.1 hypothetical protein PPERSA_11254 [Pseudocohnilembus persalinus]